MFWFAVSFLTRLRVPEATHHADAATRARAPICFPLVGALIGLVTALVIVFFGGFFPFPLAVLLGLIIEVFITGAMHEDALADSADALGGGWKREDVLRILKDSRLGTYGVLALVLGVGLRYVALLSLPLSYFGGALIISGAAGRLLMLYLLACLPPIPERKSLSGDLGDGITRGDRLLAAGALAPGILLLLAYNPVMDAVLALLGAGVVCVVFLYWYRGYLQRRLGGSTGDLLGASAFIGQLIVLLALCAGV